MFQLPLWHGELQHDAAIYAWLAKRMSVTGDFSMMAYDFAGAEPYFNKPPGQFWMTAGVLSVLGDSLPAVRLVPALFDIASALLLYAVVRQQYPRVIALSAGVIYCLHVDLLKNVGEVRMDAGLIFTQLLAALAGVRLLRRPFEARRSDGAGEVAGIGQNGIGRNGAGRDGTGRDATGRHEIERGGIERDGIERHEIERGGTRRIGAGRIGAQRHRVGRETGWNFAVLGFAVGLGLMLRGGPALFVLPALGLAALLARRWDLLRPRLAHGAMLAALLAVALPWYAYYLHRFGRAFIDQLGHDSVRQQATFAKKHLADVLTYYVRRLPESLGVWLPFAAWGVWVKWRQLPSARVRGRDRQVPTEDAARKDAVGHQEAVVRPDDARRRDAVGIELDSVQPAGAAQPAGTVQPAGTERQTGAARQAGAARRTNAAADGVDTAPPADRSGHRGRRRALGPVDRVALACGLVFFILIHGSGEPVMRYALPLFPWLSLAGAVGAVALPCRWWRARRGWNQARRTQGVARGRTGGAGRVGRWWTRGALPVLIGGAVVAPIGLAVGGFSLQRVREPEIQQAARLLAVPRSAPPGGEAARPTLYLTGTDSAELNDQKRSLLQFWTNRQVCVVLPDRLPQLPPSSVVAVFEDSSDHADARGNSTITLPPRFIPVAAGRRYRFYRALAE